MRASVLRSRWTFLSDTWGIRGAWLFTAAVVATHAAAAWFNAGFLSADEHYQIIEFAQYKLGRQSVAALAWEFGERMRPALQPWLAAVAIRLHHAAGVMSPFLIAFSLRLLSTTLGAIVALEVCLRCLRKVESRLLRQSAVFLTFFLWMAPTAHGRFSSENWSGMWLAAGLCLLVDALDASSIDRRRSWLLGFAAGAAWGFAFYFRFQVAAAIAGAALWALIVRRASGRLAAAMAIAFLGVCAVNALGDHWLYGVWTFTPLNYLRVNLVEGRSAAYGVSPWWLIGVYASVALIPPFSLALIVLLAAGSWYARREAIVWTVIPFLAVHTIVAHKEPRFVLPLVYFVGSWLAIGAAALPAAIAVTLARWRRPIVATAAAFCLVNAAALCVAIVLPANDRIALDRWLRDQHARGVRTVYALAPRKTVVPANVTNSFYDSGIALTPVTAIDELSSRRPVFVYYASTAMPAALARMGCTPVFETFPRWLSRSKLVQRLAEIETDSVCRADPGR